MAGKPRAPSYLVSQVKRLVQAGRREPCCPHIMWLPNWRTALRWQDESRYAFLIYQAEEPLTEEMQSWIGDAFGRVYGKVLVQYREVMPGQGVYFYGGVPPEFPLPKIEFPRLDDARRTGSHGGQNPQTSC